MRLFLPKHLSPSECIWETGRYNVRATVLHTDGKKTSSREEGSFCSLSFCFRSPFLFLIKPLFRIFRIAKNEIKPLT